MEEFTLETTVLNFENAVLKIVNDLKFGKNAELKIVSFGHDLEIVELNIANSEADYILWSCRNFLPEGTLRSSKLHSKRSGSF